MESGNRSGSAAGESTPIAREGEALAPVFKGEAFHCMHCGVLARQWWSSLLVAGSGSGANFAGYARCKCSNCNEISVWNVEDERCVDPVIGGGPRPHLDMPEQVKVDYEEARRIVGQSPRGACALLRLGVQKLCEELGGDGKNINDDIKSLVEKGLPEEVQKALDSLRVIGNNAVHPGEMDLTDDTETASALFNLLNFVVEEMISKPQRRRGIFESLPVSVRQAIQIRDGK
jgi:hypothetical protein